VDQNIISRAKRYAKQQGVSVSAMVEAYLAAVSESQVRNPAQIPPVLRAVRGSLKKADAKEYKKHLVTKYR
jgi:hypothetical protein